MTALAQLPFEQPSLLQAAPQLRALAAQGPIRQIHTATGDPAWLVTGYTEVRRPGSRRGTGPGPRTARRAVRR